jgi:glucosamine-6-phosphate deaminase
MNVTVFPDAASVGEALAAEIADGMAAAAAAGHRYLLGCPGGRSPQATYRALARQVTARRLDLSGVVLAMMDDYVVPAGGSYVPAPADAHYSCRNFAATTIAGPLSAAAGPGRGITADQVWFPDAADPARYDDRLRAAGGVNLFILASGESDGHVAFNPPGTPENARSRVVRLADSTRRDNLGTFPEFGDLRQVPHYGVTVGVATIAELSARVVLVADGPAKRQAIARLMAAPGYDPAWPATVAAICRDASVYADRAAAGLPGPAEPSDQHAEQASRQPAGDPQSAAAREPAN